MRTGVLLLAAAWAVTGFAPAAAAVLVAAGAVALGAGLGAALGRLGDE